MRLTREEEMAYRRKRGLDRLGDYEAVIFGLGNSLFGEVRPENRLALRECLDELYSFSPYEYVGVRGARRILYRPTRPTAAAANFCFEKYLCHGPAARAIGVGYVGSLQPEIGIGELIIPNLAWRGEGVSHYYLPEGRSARPSHRLVNALIERAEQEGFEPRVGDVYTTDVYHMETPQFIRSLHKRGILGIDMETSALFVVADWHGKESAAILVVTDEPFVRHHQYLFEVPEIAAHNLQRAIKVATRVLLDVMP
jgi:nucleoside phosphorylase